MLRELVTFFVPPLAPGSGHYTIRLVDQGTNLFKELSVGGSGTEFISLDFPRADGPVPKTEILLRIPAGFSEIQLADPKPAGIRPMHKTERCDICPESESWKAYGWIVENAVPPTLNLNFSVK